MSVCPFHSNIDTATECFTSRSSPCYALWPAVGCIVTILLCPWGLQSALFNHTEMPSPTTEMQLLTLQSLAAALTAGADHRFYDIK